MDATTLFILSLVLTPVIIEAWQNSRSLREPRGDVHHHSKRHMLPREVHEARLDARKKRRTTTQRTTELRKKPSGHLRPLQEDDMENDEVVSVVIGPPAMRPQYERLNKHTPKPTNCTVANDSTPISTNLVKNLLVQLGREFLTHQVNEDFVFGQYIGNSMRNLTNEFRLKMQHEILDLVVKYQKLSRGELNMSGLIKSPPHEEISSQIITRGVKMEKRLNETDEVWPDFTNLANIVG